MSSSAIGTPTFLAKVQNLTDGDGNSASQFLPAGTVLPFAGTTAPAGFLLCNGATISRTTYSKLFAAIGSAHGSGDGSTTFHLPDYRGRFLRGTDGGAARDPDRAGRTAANTGGNTGDAVGSVQANATAKNGLASAFTGSSATTPSGGSHNHSTTFGMDYGYGGTLGVGITGSNFSNFTSPAKTIDSTNSGHTHTLTATGTNAVTGDNETRPLNANVNYIIKI